MRPIASKISEDLMAKNRLLAEVSKRVRYESMKVNAESAAIERDPDVTGAEDDVGQLGKLRPIVNRPTPASAARGRR